MIPTNHRLPSQTPEPTAPSGRGSFQTLGKTMKIAFVVAAVVALLVIVNFLAFRKHLRRVQELPIALPTAGPTDLEPFIPVVVLSSTSCKFAGSVIEISSLKERLVAAKAEGKSSVSVKAAHGVSSEALIPVLDLIRQAGIEHVSIEVGLP